MPSECTLTISADALEALGACGKQVKAFRRLFGDGDVPMTRRNWNRAIAARLSVAWLARFLSDAARAEFDRVAWDEFVRAIAAARFEYDRVIAVALYDIWRADQCA